MQARSKPDVRNPHRCGPCTSFRGYDFGDEMQLSTSLASCVALHSDVLSTAEIAKLNLLIYKLDAEVMARMWAFIESRHLADAFNDEQEAKRVK
jgi:hypothetical protein